jgi:hypothetical protein
VGKNTKAVTEPNITRLLSAPLACWYQIFLAPTGFFLCNWLAWSRLRQKMGLFGPDSVPPNLFFITKNSVPLTFRLDFNFNKKTMKKYGKKVLMGLLVLVLGLQFVRPEKNTSGVSTNALSTKYPVPEAVMAILKPACMDCHSNSTRYPWYAEIQPVGIWLADHVNDGKRHLNFSEFTAKRIAVQNHKFEEIIENVKEEEMPLSSYTWIHSDAKLTPDQRALITTWAQSMMDTIKLHYPADSLVLRRK